ncbi:MAG: LCP family protein [Candidatus Subteraquimicrobiales bacterium]|nr:LCP family protein [Candidatus Subteraquimicrobiales bacterium]
MKEPVKSRTRRRLERRRFLLKKVLVSLGVLASFVLVTVFVWTHDINFPFIGSPKKFVHKITGDEILKERATFLVIGTEKSGKKIISDGLFLMIFDSKRKKVDGLMIPKGAMVTIPSQGQDTIDKALIDGDNVLINTVRNFVGVEVDYLIKLSLSDFKKVQGYEVNQILKKPYETTLSKEELKAYERAISEVVEEDVRIVYLPVKPITIGQETFFEPERDKIEKLVQEFWQIEASITHATRVIILNGCGVPMIGSEAAWKLIKAGFRVMDVKNADNFNYKTTKIIYCKENLRSAEKVKEVLKVGEIKVGDISQDHTDLIVIIGKDFEPTKNE